MTEGEPRPHLPRRQSDGQGQPPYGLLVSRWAAPAEAAQQVHHQRRADRLSRYGRTGARQREEPCTEATQRHPAGGSDCFV